MLIWQNLNELQILHKSDVKRRNILGCLDEFMVLTPHPHPHPTPTPTPTPTLSPSQIKVSDNIQVY